MTPGGALYGTTSQRWRGPRRSIVLRISKNGKAIDRNALGINVRCGSRTEGLYLASSGDVPLAADGTLKLLDRYTVRDGCLRIHITDRLAGRLGMAGGSGTLSRVERYVDRRTGRTLGRCRSGSVKWTVAP